MNVECYAEILRLQGKDPEYHAAGHQYKLCVESFRTDLLKNKAVWVDDWKKDWVNFMKNNHALYSIFTCPPEHEYTRRERFVVLLCCSSLFSFVAMIAVNTLNELRASGAGATELFLTENGINITGAIIISVVMMKLQIMATCACYQDSEESKRERMERIGHIVMGVWSLISAGAFVAGVIITNGWNLIGSFFVSLVVQVIANIIVPTIFLTALFHVLWIREHRMKPETQSSFIVCFHDYCDYQTGCPLRSCANKGNGDNDNDNNASNESKVTVNATIAIASRSEIDIPEDELS